MQWTHIAPNKIGIYVFAREYVSIQGAMRYAEPSIVKIFENHLGVLLTERNRGVFMKPSQLSGLWLELPIVPELPKGTKISNE